MKKITVLGVGNILLKDEGLGVKTIEQIQQQYRLPDNVQVLDGGTLGMGLIPFLADTEKLIIVDAISGNSKPGSIYELRDDKVKLYYQQTMSMHDLGIQDVLATMDFLGKSVNEIVVIGMEPETIDVGLELSPIVAPGIGKLVDMIISQLDSWKVEVEKVG